jgi:hypothetical protein
MESDDDKIFAAAAPALTMFNPWLSIGLKAWQIALEAQSVMALRMPRLAAGGYGPSNAAPGRRRGSR